MATTIPRSHPRALALPWAYRGRLALLIALLVAVALRLVNLGAYAGSFDEGVRSEQLLLMARGFRPFRDIFSSQGVLLLDLLYPFFLAGGQTLTAIRFGVVVLSLVGLAGIYQAAAALGGRRAGLLAVGLLALSPLYLAGSRLALAEVPSLAPALLGLAAALRYQQTGRRRDALLACLLGALALLVKPMALPIVVPVGLALLLRGRRAWADIALGVALALAVSVALVLLMGPGGVYEQLVAYRGGAEQALQTRGSENVRLLRQGIMQDGPGLLALALVGGLLLLRRAPRAALPPIAWLGGTLLLILLYDDLSDKHLAYLTPPLALLAACAPVLGWDAWRRPRMDRLAAGLAALGVVAYLAFLPVTLPHLRDVAWPDVAVIERRRDRATEDALARQFASLAGPDDFVVSDSPQAAFAAGRMVPPRLADPSGTRVDAGSLTSAGVIAQVVQYQPKAIAVSTGRTGRLQSYVQWLDAHYRLAAGYADGDWRLYVPRDAGGPG